MTPWRIVFMGTPDFAVPSLEALVAGEDPVVGVFTQPDSPAGRGMHPQPSAVKRLALARQLPLFQPERMRHPEAVASLRALQPDLVVVIAYGQILPRTVLDTPTHGCINVHASLLPRWRGAAPIHRALLAGDTHTGITTMAMDEGLDTGAMLLRQEFPITPTTTGGALHDQLSRMAAPLLMATLLGLHHRTLVAEPQPSQGITYAHKLTKEEAALDWRAEAKELERRIRAFNPWPGAFHRLGNAPLKILSARITQEEGQPGTVIALTADGPVVACGSGSLILTELQPPGKRRMSAVEWLRGHPVTVGSAL